MDMFYMEDTGEVFIAHQNVLKYPRTETEHPLTIRSNYQELGEWKLESESKTDETDKFVDFIDKVIEMRKIFKLNPSMVLFLQDIDVRNYDDIDSKITKTRLDKMNADLIRDAVSNLIAAAAAPAPAAINRHLSGFAWFVAAVGRVENIIMDSACNDIDKKIKNIMDFVYALRNPDNPDIDLIAPAVIINIGQPTTEAIAEKMYNFINDLLFMLVYTGCNGLAELICNDYVNLVITPPQGAGTPYTALNRDTWRTRFEAVLDANQPIKAFIVKIGEKTKVYKEKTRITPDISYDFRICSEPETNTGVAYLVYNYNQNLNSLITLKSQENLKNKIYEYGKDSFFSSNEQFHTNNIIDENAMEQIEFCSFYKFDRRTSRFPLNQFGEIGNADSETIYVSVDIYGDGIKSSQVFEFLDIIRRYFVNLRSGAVIVDIGISGPVKRLIIGGDFGCNLLNDAEVCRKFKSKNMKIYTMDKNKSSYDLKDTTNHIFMIDVDLELAQVGGNNGGYKNDNNQNRIYIGERIEDKNRVVTSKRKTRRKVPLLLSSS
jgi:hypothetical protein